MRALLGPAGRAFLAGLLVYLVSARDPRLVDVLLLLGTFEAFGALAQVLADLVRAVGRLSSRSRSRDVLEEVAG